jgi:polyhydroxyalkanoate synthesis regulator phasin
MKAEIGRELAAQERGIETRKKAFHGMARKLPGMVPAIAIGLMALAVAFPIPAWTQDKAADNMQILQEKIKADKKLVVAQNMGLTESEAKAFWPVYDQYQNDLAAINQRMISLIQSYAADYNAQSMTDEKAKKLIHEFVAIGKAEGGLNESYVPKLLKVLPPKKVARYLQIENKIRAAVKYEIAGKVPLVQ